MTPINVNLQQAHNAFVSCLESAHQQRADVLDVIYQEKVKRIDQYQRVLTQLATEGMEEQITPLLSTLLEEWAVQEALALLLRSQNGSVDPAHQGLQRAFWDKLGRQHQALSSDLLLQIQRGKEQRARAEQERAQSWQAVAFKSFEQQQNQQQQFHTTALHWVQGQQQQHQQWFQQQQAWFDSSQHANREWANTAIVGVQQAQLGLKQWYDFAASAQANVANLLAGTEQRQPMMVEQAVRKATTKKWMTKITIMGLVLIGIVSLFGCAFFAMMHLY